MTYEEAVSFQEWLEENEDEMWASFHESGAYLELDSDYEEWCYHHYEKEVEA
jgi:hypothetical protein